MEVFSSGVWGAGRGIFVRKYDGGGNFFENIFTIEVSPH